MSIILTSNAAKQAKKMIKDRGCGLGLRIDVKTTGCSGLSHTLGFVDELIEGDKVFNSQGVTIVVNEMNLAILTGTELDFLRSGLNEGFEFNNPNAKAACGCGMSFTT